jgi:two-component system phosphate regulon sensor histidine kinase PhoR
MYQSFSWLASLLKVIFYLVLVALLGYYLQAMMSSLLVGVSSLLVIHYWRLYRLNYWLWHSKKLSPPHSLGIWAHVYQGIYNTNLKNRNKRKALGDVIRRFRQGSEALPDAVVVVDVRGEISWCNRLARIELGLRWPQDVGRSIASCLDAPSFTQYFIEHNFEQPIEITSPINPNKVLELRVVSYGEDQWMLLIRDVTRLNQMEKMRKDFVANVSHELKTPLTVINGYLEMLPDIGDIPPALLTKALSEMRSQSLRMQSLVEELLVLSRIEASIELAFEKLVNVSELLWHIQLETEALNKDRKHKIFFDISPILYVYGIESELRSAFSNLIFNAIHYTPAQGVIEVKWYLEGDQAKFSVKDNGDGIAGEHIDRLTERFYRVDQARSRKTGGSGLGLAIVKHVLSHHNSILVIESSVGNGAEFSCRFSPELSYIADKKFKAN